MNCAACHRRLHDLVDEELTAAEAAAVTAHVEQCAQCREQLEALRALSTRAAALPKEIAPSRDLWRDLSDRLAVGAADTSSARSHSRPLAIHTVLRGLIALGVAAGIAVLCTIADRGLGRRPAAVAWSVEIIAGAPQVDRKSVRDDATLRVGQWLITDAKSQAKVSVGEIGHVTIAPESRVRLVDVAADNHRLQLERGSLRALIWAPPRIFFVNTPSATAVDYGCAYTLSVDDEGNGELEVTLGYVKLEHGHRESIIPRGMACLTRRATGPGTPFSAEAAAGFRAAIARFDFGPASDRAEAVAEILAHAEKRDAVTLWHLLARTQRSDRAHVFDTLAELAPPPSHVTREGILAGNASMRNAWGQTLGLSVALP